MHRLLLLPLIGCMLLGLPWSASAAEVLQVRNGTLLQVGDHNRTYTVRLACVDVPTNGEEAASEWLRKELPRRTKVNLRPIENRDGTLVARVQPLSGNSSIDLSEGLVAAGLANTLPGC
jgi:endonuclease YncB( thermonuclease family)